MAEQLPRTFGDFVLERRLGVGGMAETFVARRGATEQRVCVKRVLPAFSSDAQFVQQFEREARLAGRLRHSNVVGVVDFGSVDGELYLALELVEGVDLRALLQSQPERRLPEHIAALIALDLTYALEYAHHEHVIHRDVTPSNVLLSIRGEVKLADFGVAKALTGATLPTASGFLKGKVPYMAPEQMKGGTVDGRTDFFSLGVTLFEMLAGRRPFVGAHDVEVMMKVLGGERPRLSEVTPNVHLEPIVDRLLSVDIAGRPGVTELVHTLAPLVRADSRPTLAALVQAACGMDDVDPERDTAFAAAMVPSTLVSHARPARQDVIAPEFQATAAQRPLGMEPRMGATAAARPGLLMGTDGPRVESAGGVAGALALAPSVIEVDAASASGVVARAERFEDVTDPTAPLRAPRAVEEPVVLPSRGAPRTVIVAVTIFVGLGGLAMFAFRNVSNATQPGITTPVRVERVVGPEPRVEPVDSAMVDTSTADTSMVDTSMVDPVDTDTAMVIATPRVVPTDMRRPTMQPITREPITPIEAITTMEPVETMEPATMEPVVEPPSMVQPAVDPPVVSAMEGVVREGRVRVSLVPWGEVWIGERYMGRAPLVLTLPQGSHTIRIGMGRPMRNERVRVVADATRDLEFVFAE